MKLEERIGFIGGGNMGYALIKGLVESGRIEGQNILVFDPDEDRTNRLAKDFGITVSGSNRSLVREVDIILLAVKPQILNPVLQEIAVIVRPEQLVISIAAGVTLYTIESTLHSEAPVVRVMPNTPSLVMAGASALAPGEHATNKHLATTRNIFEAVGVAIVVEEKVMDVITALSGSGPAYVAVFLEALADGAVRMGLSRKDAIPLVTQTVLGTAKLAQETGTNYSELKDMVTSPGGTAIAGIHALEKNGFRAAVIDAIEAATKRSQELGTR